MNTDLRPPKCDGCGDFEFCFGASVPTPQPAAQSVVAIQAGPGTNSSDAPFMQ